MYYNFNNFSFPTGTTSYQTYQCSTNANTITNYNFAFAERHCAVSPCGRPCHKVENCRLIDFKKDDSGFWNLECVKCGIINHMPLKMCMDKEVPQKKYLEWYYVVLSMLYIRALNETIQKTKDRNCIS